MFFICILQYKPLSVIFITKTEMQKFGGVSEGHTNSCAQHFRIAGTKSEVRCNVLSEECLTKIPPFV
jgi:hypothetical protein